MKRLSKLEETFALQIRGMKLLPAMQGFIDKHASRIQFGVCCWEWVGGKTGNGYGAVRINGRQIGAHVAAYQCSFGPVPDGKCVMHTCDNPLCIRPDHLVVGSTEQNMQDRTEKGRAAAGEKNGRAKLTEDQVTEIRGLLKAGVAKRAIARRFGVSDTLIRYVSVGKAWSEKGKRSPLEDSFRRQLEDRDAIKWVEEYRFHPTRKWRFDFCWPEQRLAVEIEGSVWTNGRHTRGSGFIADTEKYNTATLMGWRVLRFDGGAVNDGTAIQTIAPLISKPTYSPGVI